MKEKTVTLTESEFDKLVATVGAKVASEVLNDDNLSSSTALMAITVSAIFGAILRTELFGTKKKIGDEK